MSTKKKLLQAAAGSAGGAGGLNVEDVFSTYLYEGNGANNYIKNDINIGNGAAENTVLHLTGDTLSDSSPFNHTMTAVGNTSVNTSTKKYGTGSIYFDGTGDYLRAEDSRFVLGSYDFTIEFWLNLPDASPTKGIFHIWDNTTLSNYSIALYHIGNDLTLQFKNGVNGTPNGSISSTTDVITNNTWHHIAAVRHNNTINLYVDGTAVSSGFDATGINLVMNYFELGTHWDSNYTFTGYIDDFRITRGTARYTSNFTTPTSALSLDTATTGEGGLVWVKERTSLSTGNHELMDTERGTSVVIFSDLTNGNFSKTNGLTSFNSNGFSIGSNGGWNNNTSDFASWTFRKAPKFFDVVTYTGTGVARTVSHNLGSVPAMIIVKRTDSATSWNVYHRGLNGGTNPHQYGINLNTTGAEFASSGYWNNTAPTSTEFTVGTSGNANASGGSYVAYLFAHNDGDGTFGSTADQDIIKCGSYTGTGSDSNTVDLGFEPQWILWKSSTSAEEWHLVDNMRGWLTDDAGTDYRYLRANAANAEGGGFGINITSTGFEANGSGAESNASGSTYIYIAIRRGPMAVPTDATDVFAIDGEQTTTSGSGPAFITNFVTDMLIEKQPSATSSWPIGARLQGNKYLVTDAASAETTGSSITWDYMNGTSEPFNISPPYQAWMWKRAPNFFDVVTYTGDGVAGRTVSHNLGVAPEMMWIKNRDGARNWAVYHKELGGTKLLYLNGTNASITESNIFNNTDPTESVFTLGSNRDVNSSISEDHIAYLFASLDGVSKVGSYTGNDNGSNSQVIDCGFSSGARFVLIKLTSTSGYDWYVFDTERGIVAGDDPYLLLNTTGAEQTVWDGIDPHSSGFEVRSSTLNVSGATYIFYAVA